MSWRRTSALALALGLLAAPGQAAVTYTSDVDKTPATGTSIAYTAFAISGSNPVVALLIALDSTTATVSGVVCSAGLTCGTPVEVKTQRDVNDALRTYVSLWCLPAPSGTGTITATLSASVPWQSNAILLAGAHQTTPCTGGDAVSANAATSPLSVTPANLGVNDAAAAMCANAGNGDAPTFTSTQTFNNNTTNVNAAGGYHLGTGAVACTWGTATTDDVIVAIRIATAAGGAAALVRSHLVGIGP